MPYNIGKYGDLYYFNQKDEKARQEQLEAILNVDKDELLEIAKEIDETLEKVEYVLLVVKSNRSM